MPSWRGRRDGDLVGQFLRGNLAVAIEIGGGQEAAKRMGGAYLDAG
jgi:hypothetical protein